MKIFASRIAAAVVAAFFMPACGHVRAQAGPAICGPYEQMAEKLKAEFDEHLTGRGLTATGQAFEIWSSDAGTWTAVIRSPIGTTCAFASGNDWETFDGTEEKDDVY